MSETTQTSKIFSDRLHATTPDTAFHVACCPRTGAVLREATEDERRAYIGCNAARCGVRRGRAFDQPVRYGDVTVDLHTGPGAWHGGAGF